MDPNVPDKPLSGIRVLDAATFLAGPFCATILAEFGAEVIKVEHPAIDDPLRNLGTRVENGETLIWLSEARNKRNITLNLADPDGSELFKRMARQADVVIENFRPGTMERWGLGYNDLSAINPGLVMVRITAYGQNGPYKNRPGFARIAHAFSGITYLTGESDGRPLTPGSMALGDYLSGLYGALGAMMALRQRDNDGRGQYVDVALYETVFRFLDELAPAFARFGAVRERMGADVANIAPHSHYQCADGSWVALACSSDKMFERLAVAMKRPELAGDPRFSRMQARIENRDAVNQIVAEWIGRHSRDELMRICLDNEVPCGPINSIADIFADPHFQERGSLMRVRDDEAGELVLPAIVPRLSRTPGTLKHLGRHKGVDTEAVMGEWLGLDAAEIARLRARGVV
ncbi:MAG TPA: CaiB/BaiF CoA-transferase family protein [Candidatus Binataceae bacterium]|nr:CaiB/BaiF CoA-transferase family protein [Candidatus Binataceae bacterium]